MPGRVKLTTNASAEPISINPKQLKRPAAAAPSAGEAISKKPRSNDTNGAPANRPAASKPREKSSIAPSFPPLSTNCVLMKRSEFPCPYPNCTKSFTRPCRLTEHERSHTGERPFACKECSSSFLRESHLTAHVRAKHLKDKRYVCKYVIARGEEAERGVFGFKRVPAAEVGGEVDGGVDGGEKAAGGGGREGRECGARFTTSQHLKRHLESHSKPMPHVCKDYPPCTEGFRKKGPLSRHIRESHLGLLPWGCPHTDPTNPSKPCGASFAAKRQYELHISTHHSGLPPHIFYCATCHKNSPSSPTTSASPIEDLSTTPSVPFPVLKTAIPEAGAAFPSFHALRQHTREAHPPTCSLCPHVSPSHRALRAHHVAKHSSATLDDRRVHICEACGKGLTSKRYLVAHVKIVHLRLRPFECDKCERRFPYKAVLQRHVLRHHTPAKPATRPKTAGRAQRKNKVRKLGLVERLTGFGYDDSGRDIKCVVDGCRWRYARMYDLRVHLGSMNGHAMVQEQVEEVMREVGGESETEDEGSEWDEEEGWSELGSESEGEEDWGGSSEAEDQE